MCLWSCINTKVSGTVQIGMRLQYTNITNRYIGNKIARNRADRDWTEWPSSENMVVYCRWLVSFTVRGCKCD